MAIGYTGVPSKKQFGDLRKLTTTKDRVTYALQKHYSKRQNKTHYDLRLGTPSLGLYSWAIPKAKLPEEDEKLLAIRTPIHRHSYKNFKGVIPTGYGAGKVEVADSGFADIHKATPKNVRYSIQGQPGTSYQLIKTKNKTWLFFKR